MNGKKYSIWIVWGLLLIAISLFSTIIAFFADLWWFREVGYTEIFLTAISMKFLIGASVAVFSFLFLYINIVIATKAKTSWFMVLPEGMFGQPVSLSNSMTRKVGAVIALVVAVFLGLVAASGWQDVLKFLNATPFGTTDPIFGRDISFYVFSLPVITFVLGILKTIIIAALMLVGGIYIFRGLLSLATFVGNLFGARQRPAHHFSQEIDHEDVAPKARFHTATLLFALLFVIAVSTYYSLFKLLTGQTIGQLSGSAFTGVNVMVPLIWMSIFALMVSAIAVLYWGRTGRAKFFIGAMIIYFLVGFATSIIPSLFQKLVVAPNELVKETPYIEHNIEATRDAYGLDAIEEREISGDKPLTQADIANNNLTIKNVRLWERTPLLSTFSQLQEIRTYYEFASVDNDRYMINGEIRQVMLSPRELSSESLPNRNWINERLTFTHGYGVALGPVNQVTKEGLPVLFVKDLPPQSSVKELKIDRPEIYYGELPNDYVFTNTKSKEFDYPKGEENVYSVYAGNGGVEINSFTKRVLYAIHFRSLKLILSNDITEESKILYRRNIVERASLIAPFLTFDRDPYSVIVDGKIYWVLDAYTTSNLYPYSQVSTLGSKKVNYIRNSVKVIIDAYDGKTTLYLADTEDPIIKTYSKIFPNSFRPITEMPKNLASHMRYPEDIFALQSGIYTTYHMTDPQIFYNKEDQWEVPVIPGDGAQNGTLKNSAMTPRHMVMKLPGEKSEEYVLMLPFTPRAKDNLSAWMVAKNDGENYGKLVVYRFPKQKLIFGPKQVIGRINQDAEVSRQISLWDQRGSQVIQGSLLVIPIEESLIYVRPLYLKAQDGKIPELKRVLVSYGNKVAMEETLEAGLARIFGGTMPVAYSDAGAVETGGTSARTNEMISQAEQAYQAAINAQQNGDWARYGEEIKKLGDILKNLR
ncbi:MAG: UPF0182 family protein [Patescibacteria group bacterium]